MEWFPGVTRHQVEAVLTHQAHHWSTNPNIRILLDHNVPSPLKNNLPGHDTDTAADRGWQDLNTGELLDQAETDAYELFLISGGRIPFQQNLIRRNISVLILTTKKLSQKADELMGRGIRHGLG